MFKRILSVALALAMLVSCFALAACKDDGSLKRDPNAEYTYNTFLSTFPTVWNNHTYQTATDSEIIGYTETGFYTLITTRPLTVTRSFPIWQPQSP